MSMDTYAILQNDNVVCLGQATSKVRRALLAEGLVETVEYTGQYAKPGERCFPDHVTFTDRFQIGDVFLIMKRCFAWYPHTFGRGGEKMIDVTPDQVKQVYLA